MAEEQAESDGWEPSTKEDVQSTTFTDTDFMAALVPSNGISNSKALEESHENASHGELINRSTERPDELDSMMTKVGQMDFASAKITIDRHKEVRYITMANMDIKMLFNVKNNDLSGAYAEFPNDFNFLHMALPMSVSQDFR